MSKLLAKYIAKADKLAYDNMLCRKTTNVVEHPKTQQLTIVEEVTRFDGDHEITQRFYRAVPSGGKIYTMQDEVNILKTEATFRALGKEFPSDKFLPTGGSVVEVEEADDVDEDEDEEVEVEVKTKKSKPKKGKKKPKPVEKDDEDDDEDESEPEAKVEEKPAKKRAKGKKKKICFDKDTVAHVRHAGEIIKRLLGDDWKDEKENKDAVKDLLFNVLHNRVNVCESGSDKALKTFTKKVEEFLRDKLDLAGDDDDVGGL